MVLILLGECKISMAKQTIGDVRRSIKDERPDYLRRGDSNLTMRSAGARDHSYSRIDEGYNSMSGTSIGSNRSVSRPFHILWARIR
jgi:hypothetical protein